MRMPLIHALLLPILFERAECASRCCSADQPEPGRAGRCSWLALQGRCAGSGDGLTLCPVACGECLICKGHSQRGLYEKIEERANAHRARLGMPGVGSSGNSTLGCTDAAAASSASHLCSRVAGGAGGPSPTRSPLPSKLKKKMKSKTTPTAQAVDLPPPPPAACCADAAPDGNRSGRCSWFAGTGGCTRDGKHARQTAISCPAACGLCLICSHHPLRTSYSEGGELWKLRKKAERLRGTAALHTLKKDGAAAPGSSMWDRFKQWAAAGPDAGRPSSSPSSPSSPSSTSSPQAGSAPADAAPKLDRVDARPTRVDDSQPHYLEQSKSQVAVLP